MLSDPDPILISLRQQCSLHALFPVCFLCVSTANQNKPLSWNQPELSIPDADQKDRSSGNENACEPYEQFGLSLRSCRLEINFNKINNKHYYTLNSLSIFSLVKSLQLILEISATYRLVNYLLADNCARNALFPRAMSKPCDGLYVVIYFKTMYKTIIRRSFCDIRNNQGLEKCHQPRPWARLITLTARP